MNAAATGKTGLGVRRLLWLLLLPLPAIVGYAQGGDLPRAMTKISNAAAKGDRLPVSHPSDAAWMSCAPPQTPPRIAGCEAMADVD